MKMMRIAALVGVVWAGLVVGLGQGVGQAGGKADSSASLRNDKQASLRNDKQASLRSDKQKRPMTFADLMAMKRVSDPQISPSGKWVMFSVMDVSLEKNSKTTHLWVVGLEGGAERQITFADGESNGRFSPDGKTISLTRKDQIFEMPWDEAAGKVGDPIQVTNVAGGADGSIWSPDSKRLMFVAGVYPECSVRGGGTRTSTNAGVPPLRAARSGRDDGAGGTGRTGRDDGAGGTGRTGRDDGAGGTGRTGRDDGAGGTGRTGRDDGSMGVWAGTEAAGWAEEDACDKAKDEAAEKSPVKAQVWDALLYRHWDRYLGLKRSHVLVVDSDSGRNLRDLTPSSVVGDAETPTFSLGGPLGYAWAPDSEEIAYVTNLDKVPAASTNNDVFTLRLDEAGSKAVKVSTSPGSDDGPAYSPDGKWLAFRSQARNGFESDKFRLMLMDRDKKTTEALSPDWFTGWVDEFAWSQDSKSVLFATGRAGEEPVLRVALAGGRLEEFNETGELSDLRPLADGGLVVTRMRVDEPSTIERFPATAYGSYNDVVGRAKHGTGDGESGYFGSGMPLVLTSLNTDVLQQLNLAKFESFWFSGAEGTKVQGFILRPPGFDPAKKYPVKFLMHGGPQTAWGDAWSFRWNWELMAANGYVVVGINRRGSTGYGQKFVDEVSGDWGGRAYVDLMKGLDYAEAQYPFMDKTRECALGASYGGFMADWVLTHTDRFKCIVTHDGLYDPASAYGDTEEMWFNEWEFRRAEDFPKGWDGFSAGYDATRRARRTNAGVSPLRPAASGRDDGTAGGSRSGRDDGDLGGSASGRNDGGLGDEGTKTNAGVPPLRGSRSGRDDGTAGGSRSGRDDGTAGGSRSGRDDGDLGGSASGRNDGGLAEGRPAMPWRYAALPADQDPFRKWSPMLHIQDAKTPTLVIHSQKDYRLDVSQGIALFTALQRLSVPSKMLYFPDEGHWVLKPQNSQLWNEVVSDWCDRWTKTGKYAEGTR